MHVRQMNTTTHSKHGNSEIVCSVHQLRTTVRSKQDRDTRTPKLLSCVMAHICVPQPIASSHQPYHCLVYAILSSKTSVCWLGSFSHLAECHKLTNLVLTAKHQSINPTYFQYWTASLLSYVLIENLLKQFNIISNVYRTLSLNANYPHDFPTTTDV